MSLTDLRPGQRAVITRVGGAGAFRRRLLEMGILPGTPVERTAQSPYGDPLSYSIRGAVLCLRSADAATVAVEPA